MERNFERWLRRVRRGDGCGPHLDDFGDPGGWVVTLVVYALIFGPLIAIGLMIALMIT